MSLRYARCATLAETHSPRPFTCKLPLACCWHRKTDPRPLAPWGRKVHACRQRPSAEKKKKVLSAGKSGRSREGRYQSNRSPRSRHFRFLDPCTHYAFEERLTGFLISEHNPSLSPQSAIHSGGRRAAAGSVPRMLDPRHRLGLNVWKEREGGGGCRFPGDNGQRGAAATPSHLVVDKTGTVVNRAQR